MNIWDILILAVVIALVIFAVIRIRKNKGKCSCGCGGCPAAGKCNKQEKTAEEETEKL